jgi:hypothetical protein
MTNHREQQGPGRPTQDDAAFAGRILDLLVVPGPSAALLGRVLAGLPQRRVGWRELFGLVPASAFVAAIVVGLWIGGEGLAPGIGASANDDVDWVSRAVGNDVFDDGSNG